MLPLSSQNPTFLNPNTTTSASQYNTHMAKSTIKPEKISNELEISKDVLVGITSLALESVKGVNPVTPPARVGEVLAGKRLKEINVTRQDDTVEIDISLNIDYGRVIPDVAKEAQRAVAENITAMTGLKVKAVNVTVQSIVLPQDNGTAQ